MLTVGGEKIGYDIVIGAGLDTGELICARADIKRAAVITDKTVGALYAGSLLNALNERSVACEVYTVDGGEKSKSLETYCDIIGFLARNGLTKADAVISLGGGVAGDIAGFCAATYMRGIKLIHIPTSLLAMVDSSVGGKSALNLPEGKNLVGAFFRPAAVICDVDYLKTLPQSVYIDALAEIIKCGVIADKELFDSFDAADIAKTVKRCVEIKLDYVARDEFDTGVRHCLNFGHTVGHAVEKCSCGAVSHGSAVAIGMAAMADACKRNGICSPECAEKVKNRISQVGLPVKLPFKPEQLMEYILRDKKSESGGIRLAVIEDIGKCSLKLVSAEEIGSFLFGG